MFDLDGNKLRNGKRFVQFANGAADGMRCDVDGNLWAGAPPGVQIVAPSGEPIGMIRLPENCANVCFGGTKRNRLFMAPASRCTPSTSAPPAPTSRNAYGINW